MFRAGRGGDHSGRRSEWRSHATVRSGKSLNSWPGGDTRVLDVLPRNPTADAASLATLALGPEPVLAPQSVLLGSGQTPGNTVRVATDGVWPFAIVPTDAAAPGATGRAP